MIKKIKNITINEPLLKIPNTTKAIPENKEEF